MKSKLLFSLSLLLAVVFAVDARHISEAEAKSKAKDFMGDTRLKTSHKGFMRLAHKEVKSQGVNYYVFSKGENAGFIIVSGSDKTDAILGYVDSGNFDAENLPANVAYWLGEYSKQVDVAESGNFTPFVKKKSSAKTVTPLLGLTMWDQGEPYNDKCPVLANGTRTATGCVATAFAQVMYYHKWPEKGAGSHSYTSYRENFNLSVDFSKTAYRWDKMTPYYNAESTAEANEAVAELMYHVGVGCEMDYGEESGSDPALASYGLVNFFNYDKRVRCIFREFYTRDEWTEMLKNELDNSRPIVYGGLAQGGGHAFVFDGYDANDMFHVNWGWSGFFNGYFKVNILNPEGQGIGGFQGGYNSGQMATIGIMKPDSSVELPSFPSLGGCNIEFPVNTAKQGHDFQYKINDLWNTDVKGFKGLVTLGLFNKQGEMVASAVPFKVEFTILDGYEVFSASTSFNGVADGTYELFPMEKPEGSDTWTKINMEKPFTVTTVKVKGENIEFSQKVPVVDVEVSDVVINECYEGLSSEIKYNLTNNGDEFYSPLYVIVCKDTTNLDLLYVGAGVSTPILKGETIQVETSEYFNLPQGTYALAVCTAEGELMCKPVPFEVKAKPEPSQLSVVKINAKSEYYCDNFEFESVIKNDGGLYRDDILAFIYEGVNKPADFNAFANRFRVKATLPGGGSEAVLKFQQELNLPEGDYIVYLGYVKSATSLGVFNSPFTFKLLPGLSGVETVEKEDGMLTIYPNPVEDVLHLNVNGNVDVVSVYSVQGALVKESSETDIEVSDLVPGNYIVKVITNDGTAVGRFVKK